MKKQYTHWISLCLSPLLLMSAAEAANRPVNTRMVYGVEQGRQLSSNIKSNTQYMLQLASFKNERYAINYKNKIASKTTQTIHVLHKPQSVAPYHVVIGPLIGANAVIQVSQQLLASSSVLVNAPIHTANPPKKAKIQKLKPQKLEQKNRAISQAATPTKDAAISIPRQWTPVFMLSGGPAWGSPGDSQTLALQSDIEKRYVANKTNQAIGTGEVFFGVQRAIKANLNGQLGLAVSATSNFGLNGDIWEDGNSAFNNYFYQYQVNHVGVMAKGKLIGEISPLIQPYLSAGVGVGFNRSHDFTITPRIFEEVPAPDFQSNTATAFTYTVGVGLQRTLTKHLQVGIGYEFADWGQSSLSRTAGQTAGSGLSLNHLYTNELLFSITYLR